MSLFFATKPKISRSVLILCFVLVVVFVFGVGFFVGQSRGAKWQEQTGQDRVLSQGQVRVLDSKDLDFKRFWQVWDLIKESYYKQPVSDKDLFYGSLKGLVSGLGDPYSVYLDPKDAEEFESNLEGSFSGIGAEIGIRDEKLQVIAPIDGSPASRAGLMPGDWIWMINGTETIGMTVEKAVSLIRGEEGTQVTLTISREGTEGSMEVKITREKIVIDSVKWKIDEKNLMQISISTFNHDTQALFTKVVQEALTKNVKGIVLDLRGNPGGLLTTAIDIASTWVGYQPVVIERGKTSMRTFNGVSAPRLNNIPTVVLVNGGSASASEIVSGALQDYGFAKIVGTQTFGKGSVQDYRELDDGSAIKITTAAWYTPKGRSINEKGITPDVIVEYSVEQFKAKKDPQKDTAIQILLGTYEPKEVAAKTDTP